MKTKKLQYHIQEQQVKNSIEKVKIFSLIYHSTKQLLQILAKNFFSF